jgi:putative transposase
MDILDSIRKGKIKRYFHSRKKLSYPGAINHITQRAPGREKLFVENSDYLYMLHLVKTAAHKFDLSFYAFTLMPNHVHFLFQLSKDNLSSSQKYIYNTYASYFNRKYERKGHVFCGRFRQALCFDESYLLSSSLYIHVNPLVAGLSKNIMNYRWTSILPFVQNVSPKPFINYRFILELLHHDTKIARRMYKELLYRSIKIKKGRWWKAPNVLETWRDKLLVPLREIVGIPNTLSSVLYLEEDLKVLATLKYKKNPESKAARKYLIEQLCAQGYTVAEIAQKLGVSRQNIYSLLKYIS